MQKCSKNNIYSNAQNKILQPAMNFTIYIIIQLLTLDILINSSLVWYG